MNSSLTYSARAKATLNILRVQVCWTFGTNIGVILGFYEDNGKQNGNYRDYWGLYTGYIGAILVVIQNGGTSIITAGHKGDNKKKS